MTLLDIGGGFPGQNDFKLTFEEIAADINKALEEFFPPSCGVSVIAEPGRYYVTSAVTLAANVIAKKVIMEELSSFNGDQLTVTRTTSCRTDCGTANRTMMYYLNDGVYGSISMLLNDPVQSIVSPYPHRVGDWLLIDNMGAYTHCISTTFNGFKKTPIYYVMSRDTMHWIQLSCTHSLIKPC
ncbi:ornithine decarboxylase 1-like isoform X3 [Esox lucius]|uniref:ornithine decarboxylase 1-like isoform X3 n=1 Tax=Esox lucius TaxID=8010 RepID=UPI001477889A|nr:ornithine decarboxylase 1-like isoform X3 [Esox lucius]